MIIKNHFHKKGFALGLVFKQRFGASRKWPIAFSFVLFLSSSKTSRNRAALVLKISGSVL